MANQEKPERGLMPYVAPGLEATLMEADPLAEALPPVEMLPTEGIASLVGVPATS